jgi:hypothetical protein
VDADNIAAGGVGESEISDTYITSGTYTPTLTNTTNIASSTAYTAMYLRVGSIVLVAGQVDIDPTSGTGVDSELQMTLPVASNFANAYDAAGSGGDPGDSSNTQLASLRADATTDRASMHFIANTSASQLFRFIFLYRII